MRMEGARRIALTALLMVAGGCTRSADAVAQEAADIAEMQAVRAASMELDAALDALEARLHSGRGAVRLWAELAERRQGISEIACENAVMHSESMAAIERRERERAAKLRRSRVAQARHKVASDAAVGGYEYKSKSSVTERANTASP